MEAARLADNAQSLAWDLFNDSDAALDAGHIEVAIATAQESFDLTGEMEPGILPALAGAVLASALLEEGQVGRSVEVLVARAGGEELPLIAGGWRARFLELLTRSLLAAGRQTDAARAVAAAQASGDTVGLPTARAMANMTAASWSSPRQHSIRSDPSATETRRSENCENSDATFTDERSREHITRRESQRSPRASWQLRASPAMAKRNPQIAAELFLSKKTVETHLSNIFRKLDVSSRVALARTLDRADRADRA